VNDTHREPAEIAARAPYDAPMNLLERFATPLQIVMTLGMYVELAIVAGVAATPGVYGALAAHAWIATLGLPPIVQTGAACILAALAYFAYVVTVVFVVPLLRLVAPGTPEGRYPYYSFKAFQWASYNALILLVRYTCINFMRVTPLINLFHGFMGMKIGRRVQINTAIIGDSNLIEIGDDTVIGGDVTLIAHAAERGQLVAERVRIGKRVTVGLMAVVMPGCDIGDRSVIAAGAVLMKGTRVAEGEIWGGVPARKLGERKPHAQPVAAQAP
jgi:acetyltransferase-like isoleucine patch superfamily enzyme